MWGCGAGGRAFFAGFGFALGFNHRMGIPSLLVTFACTGTCFCCWILFADNKGREGFVNAVFVLLGIGKDDVGFRSSSCLPSVSSPCSFTPPPLLQGSVIAPLALALAEFAVFVDGKEEDAFAKDVLEDFCFGADDDGILVDLV